jgi:CheY-like chemotaxis protein
VIVDFQMPGMNGLELARQIFALRPAMPLLVASGFAPNMNEEKLLEQGVRGLLRKPAELSELAGLVAQSLHAAP